MRCCHDKTTDKTMPDISAVETDLRSLARRFQVPDNDFPVDLWLMLMTKGRATRSRKIVLKEANKTANKGQKFGEAYKAVSRQFAFFKKLSRMAYFRKLCDVQDRVEAVERLLAIFAKLFAKKQESLCSNCSEQGNCPYGQHLTNTNTVDNTLLISPDCPFKPPAAGAVGAMMSALNFLAIAIDPVQGGALVAQLTSAGNYDSAQVVEALIVAGEPGKGAKVFDATFTTGEHLLDAIDKLVNDFSKKELAVFELARVFNDALLPAEEEHKEEVDITSHDQSPREIRSLEEIQKALPAEFISDDLMDKRLSSGEMLVRQDMERRKRKNYFHILIDMSGSMRGLVSSNTNGFLSKGNLASALALSILKRVALEKGVVLLRFFEGAPDKLRKAEKDDEYGAIARLLGLSDYNGRSTRIGLALETGINDIVAKAKNDMGKKAEVLLISDGQDHINKVDIIKRLKDAGVKLHVLDVEAGSGENAELKEAASTYYKVDPNKLDLTEIAKKAVGI